MKILWLMNEATNRASEKLNIEVSAIVGWADVLCTMLVNNENIEFCGVFPQHFSKSILQYTRDRESYYAYYESRTPRTTYSTNNEKLFRDILNNEKPDIVHIWGTEYSHSLEMVRAFNNPTRTVVSIQGLISVYSNHYYANLPIPVIKRYTIRDFLKQDNIKWQKKRYSLRGNLEVEALAEINNVIGRTTWDYACVKAINPNINYYYGGEILRQDFYDNEKWLYETCEKHSIFTSQAYYPIKGLHYLLKAMDVVVKDFPDAKLYVGGAEPYDDSSIKGKMKIKSYGKYLKDLIRDYKLERNVIFLSKLSAEEMKKRYLKSNVFVLPSEIENSPNSLGEAMILGVPCVAANVGGVKDMMCDGIEGYLYQHNEPDVLACYIKKVFNDVSESEGLSKNAIKHAEETHSVNKCYTDYLEIYNVIAST